MTVPPDPRRFISRALADDAVADEVDPLIFDHVVEGRYHRSVVAASLTPILDRVVAEASEEDWTAVADLLIAGAREPEADARGDGGRVTTAGDRTGPDAVVPPTPEGGDPGPSEDTHGQGPARVVGVDRPSAEAGSARPEAHL
jgi:hypothetical protein